LVERSVRDREVVGSNPAIPTIRWSTAGPAKCRACRVLGAMEHMLAGALHWLGFGLCHQLPARSFFGGGVQVPVCARDTGIYVGFVISLLVIAALDRGRHRSDLPRAGVLVLAGAMVAVMAWDGVTSYAGLRATTNDIRLATGLLAGFALPLVVAPLVSSQLWVRIDPGRVLDGWRELVPWLAAIPAAFALVRWGLPLIGPAYPVIVAVCIVVTFVSVNAIIVTLAPRFERKVQHLSGAWLVLALALAISLAEVGAAAALRAWLQSLVGLG
jgi:uncharacterized membrane protein